MPELRAKNYAMKLRCTTNSIRIRIRKSELTQLATEKRIEEKIQFGKGVSLTFALNISGLAKEVAAHFLNNKLIVKLPKEIATNWINSNEVGIEVNTPLEDGDSLHILIEKDFPCLDREEEDKSDTFWELAPESPDAC